jgi:hypothetical protein
MTTADKLSKVFAPAAYRGRKITAEQVNTLLEFSGESFHPQDLQELADNLNEFFGR